MQAFLLVLGFMGLLIAFGVYVSLYLYKGGAVGKRRRVRSSGLRALAAEAVTEDYGVDEFYEGFGPTVSSTSRLARNSFLVFLAVFAVVVMLVTTFVNTLLH